MHALRCLCCVCVHALCCMHCTVYTMLYVLYCICCMDCAISLYVCMYVCMEEPGSWTNIPSCLSFLRYVLCKHHGPGYKLLARDLRLFPSLVFTEYPLQILSAWCQCHVCSAARRDSTHNKVKWMVWVQTNTERVHIMYNDLSIFHQTVPRSVAFFGGTVITLNTFFGCHSLTDLWLLTWARVTFYYFPDMHLVFMFSVRKPQNTCSWSCLWAKVLLMFMGVLFLFWYEMTHKCWWEDSSPRGTNYQDSLQKAKETVFWCVCEMIRNLRLIIQHHFKLFFQIRMTFDGTDTTGNTFRESFD